MRISKRGAVGFIVVMVFGILYILFTISRLGGLQNATAACKQPYWNQSIGSTVVFDYAYWHPGATAANISEQADAVCIQLEPYNVIFPNYTQIKYPWVANS